MKIAMATLFQMKRLAILSLFLSAPAMAQQGPPLQQQLDSMSAGVTRTITLLTGQIAADAQQIEALQKQVQTLTAEKEKAGVKPADPVK